MHDFVMTFRIPHVHALMIKLRGQQDGALSHGNENTEMITKAKSGIENVKKLGRGPILEILLNYIRKFGSYLTE